MFDRVLNTIYKEMEHNILGFSLSSFGTLLTKIVKKNNVWKRSTNLSNLSIYKRSIV